jgi:hypothetical protein
VRKLIPKVAYAVSGATFVKVLATGFKAEVRPSNAMVCMERRTAALRTAAAAAMSLNNRIAPVILTTKTIVVSAAERRRKLTLCTAAFSATPYTMATPVPGPRVKWAVGRISTGVLSRASSGGRDWAGHCHQAEARRSGR